MLRFYNAKIMPEASVLSEATELWTDGDKISYIGGKPQQLPEFEREIDLGGKLLMPGFKNAHAHSPMVFVRSYADDLPLHEWLFDKIFPIEARLTPEYIYDFERLAILEYLANGITSAFDMYFYPDALSRASTELGFRTVICGSISGGAENVERLVKQYEQFSSFNPLISMRLGFHAEYTTELDTMRELSRFAASVKEAVFAHNSETADEVRGCIERYGKTPTQLMDSLGIFDNGGGGFHCVHLSQEDIEIFKERKLWAVTCPASNAKLASGIAPLSTLLKNGVKLAIGTDGASSNNALSMFREMYLAAILQRLNDKRADAFPDTSVLEMALTGSARAMGLNDCDCLAVGKQADMVALDLDRPNTRPCNDLTRNLIYAASDVNVSMTIIAGKILYENGAYPLCSDLSSVYAAVDKDIAEMREGIA